MTKPRNARFAAPVNGARGRAFIGLGSKPAVPFGHRPKERSHTLVRFAEHLARVRIHHRDRSSRHGRLHRRACGSRLMVTARTPGIRSASDSSCNPDAPRSASDRYPRSTQETICCSYVRITPDTHIIRTTRPAAEPMVR